MLLNLIKFQSFMFLSFYAQHLILSTFRATNPFSSLSIRITNGKVLYLMHIQKSSCGNTSCLFSSKKCSPPQYLKSAILCSISGISFPSKMLLIYSAHNSSSLAGRMPPFPIHTKDTVCGLRCMIYSATALAFTRLPAIISLAASAFTMPCVPALVV